MKVFISLVPALALLASASPRYILNSTSDDIVSFERLGGNTTTPGIDSLPSCAIPCIQIAVKSASDCEITDVACMCKHRAKIAMSAKSCIVSTCGPKAALKKVRPQVQALCKAEDEKEKKRLKEEKQRQKELEKARKQAEKEQKQRDKEQREEEKKRQKEEKKKQKEEEKKEKERKKEEDKKKQEGGKEWERYLKAEKARKKKEREDAMNPEQKEELREMRLEHPPNEDPFHPPDFFKFHSNGRKTKE